MYQAGSTLTQAQGRASLTLLFLFGGNVTPANLFHLLNERGDQGHQEASRL